MTYHPYKISVGDIHQGVGSVIYHAKGPNKIFINLQVINLQVQNTRLHCPWQKLVMHLAIGYGSYGDLSYLVPLGLRYDRSRSYLHLGV